MRAMTLGTPTYARAFRKAISGFRMPGTGVAWLRRTCQMSSARTGREATGGPPSRWMLGAGDGGL